MTRHDTLRTFHPLEQYLQCSAYIDYDHPLIQEHLRCFKEKKRAQTEVAQELFEFVRDAISHSSDIHSHRVTRRASEVLQHREGICYAKSHLLAALLRGMDIPAGICYQKLTYGTTPDTGFCLHALNTLYLASEGRWIRVDARGNRPGIDAQFSLEEERLAYPVREEYGEIDYRINHPEPHPKIFATLDSHEDCQIMCSPGRLPADL
jgi:transglutaminase-like putative cysteine protease